MGLAGTHRLVASYARPQSGANPETISSREKLPVVYRHRRAHCDTVCLSASLSLALALYISLPFSLSREEPTTHPVHPGGCAGTRKRVCARRRRRKHHREAIGCRSTTTCPSHEPEGRRAWPRSHREAVHQRRRLLLFAHLDRPRGS